MVIINQRKKVCVRSYHILLYSLFGHTHHVSLCPITDITQGEKSGIIIFKGPDPLGITIVGGADTPLNGVFIQRVHPDSPASRDDRLHAGDRILAIGNHTLEDMRREEVVQTLQQAGNFVHLTILRQPEGAVETVELVKPDMGGLGLLISEGKDLPGIYVQEVVSDGEERVVSDGEERVVSDGEERVVSDGEERVVSDGEERVVSDGEERVVSDGEERVVSDGEERVVSDGEERVVSDGEERVVSDGEERVVSDGEERVVSDGEERVVSDGKERVVSDGEERVVSDGEERVVSDGEEGGK